MPSRPTWEQLGSSLSEVESQVLMVIGDFYRVIDSEDLSPAEAIRVDREIVAMQRRMRRIKEIVAEATNDA